MTREAKYLKKIVTVSTEIACLIMLLVSISGCHKADSSENVVVYTPARGDLPQHWAKAFSQKTNIRVDQVIAGTNEIYGKIVSERENPKADVWIKGGGLIPFLPAKKQGLLKPYKPKGWEDLPEKQGKILLRDGDWYWTATSVLGLGVAYNPTVLTEDEVPKTWDELAHPKWKGSIEMWDPAMSGTATLFVLATLQRLGEEEGWKYLKKFYKNLQSYTRTGSAAFKVARKEVKLAIHFQYQVIQYQNELRKEGMKNVEQNLRFYMPPNSPVIADPVALIARAPHPRAGEQFVDFIMSPGGQELLRQNGLVPVMALLSTSKNTSEAMGTPVGGRYTARDFLDRAQDLDFAWMGNNMERVIEQWKEDVEGRK